MVLIFFFLQYLLQQYIQIIWKNKLLNQLYVTYLDKKQYNLSTNLILLLNFLIQLLSREKKKLILIQMISFRNKCSNRIYLEFRLKNMNMRKLIALVNRVKGKFYFFVC